MAAWTKPPRCFSRDSEASEAAAAPAAPLAAPAANTDVAGDTLEQAIATLHAAIEERVGRAVEQARREERERIGAEVQRQTAAIRQRAEELLRRIPEYEVDTERAVRIRSEVFRGFASLPIRW